ncbi:MAG: SGNH/GDSL hydrolase family protein [Lachnospiraceae bacterium]|nr:SGNH/GDSL hydrolase family protein [Lachnospiraceae bacterium]
MAEQGTNKNIAEGILFIAVLFIIFAVSSEIVKPDYGEVYNIVQVTQKMDSFEEEIPNTIDVIFVGNSEVYRTFSPLQIFKETGITSYCMSESALRLCDALVLIKASYNSQTPSVIFLEADSIFSDAYSHKDAYALPTNLIEDIFPIFHYHTLYKAFVPKFVVDDSVALRTEHALRGFVETDEAVPYTGPEDYMSVGDPVGINQESKKYLNRIREFCEEKNVPLVLVAAPNAKNWTYSKNEALTEYAEKYGLDFIDLNMHLKDMDINWQTDTMDGGNHMSFEGSKKTTRFIEDYLKENYDLTDHRGDPLYKGWEDDNREYELYP